MGLNKTKSDSDHQVSPWDPISIHLLNPVTFEYWTQHVWTFTPSLATYEQNINAYIMIYSGHFYCYCQGNLERGITSL